MRALAAVSIVSGLSVLLSTYALGAQSEATKARAAQQATQEARAVTLRDLRGGGSIGTATLKRIGSTRTRVTLRFSGTRNPRSVITLHRGSDCSNPQYASAASAIPLNPVSASQVSETIVNLPLTDLQSGNYLVDVRNATQSQQFVRACARLGR